MYYHYYSAEKASTAPSSRIATCPYPYRIELGLPLLASAALVSPPHNTGWAKGPLRKGVVGCICQICSSGQLPKCSVPEMAQRKKDPCGPPRNAFLKRNGRCSWESGS